MNAASSPAASPAEPAKHGLQILVVDDDKATGRWLQSVLSAEGYPCRVVQSPEEGEAVLRNELIDLTLVDIYLGDSNGLEFLKRVKALRPGCDCVMMTAHASVETVAHAVAEGAIEYLGKPILIDDLLALVRRLEMRRQEGPQEAAAELEPSPDSAIVGRSARMLEVYRAIARVAPSEATVLITGASGTGKELVARAIHAHSRRAAMPFTPINCGSLSEALLESELFGHEKGAFTGADRWRRGLIEATDGGTLFLDEVSETSLSFQVKLLRVLQEGEIRRLGSNTPLAVDVRVLAATNRDLAEMMQANRFREDLFYRLSVVTIPVPALEDRRDDIPLLVRHFLQDFKKRSGREVAISPEAVSALQKASWPGNVRELENVIERLAIFSATGEIAAEDVEKHRARRPAEAPAEVRATTLREMERLHITRALEEAEGNRSLAARRLGIERKTLYKKARRLGIDLGPGE
ncbi:MAG TPA: sigma-54 dependent transcriptional regulator [Terriglobia bacterium]|nr:sigma-54 dependent transcriptional regulator [Terriglobia bacterium]